MYSLTLVWKPLGLLVGFLWPGYASYKALEGRGTEAAAVWLTYWVVYASLAVLEAALDPLVGSWMPLYYPLKLALVLWLSLPQTRGASVVYTQVLMPFLRKHEARIDQYLEEGKRRTEDWGAKLLTRQSGEALDQEQGFSGVVSDRQAGGLRERPAAGYSSLYATSMAAGGKEEAESPAPVSRSDLFGDRPKASPASFAAPNSDQPEEDSAVRQKDN